MTLKDYCWKPITQVAKETPEVHATEQLFREHLAHWGCWCKFQWLTTMTSQIEGCVVLVHGPSGCLASARTFHEQFFEKHFGIPFLHMPNTNMTNKQVILGGEENLERAIIQVDEDYRASLMVIHTNCCAGLNMDDVWAVIERTKPKVKAKLCYIPTPGFEACWPGDVMEKSMPIYIEQLIDEPQKRNEKAVNIIGVYKDLLDRGDGYGNNSISNADEIANYITALGLKVHSVLFGGSYESIRNAAEAALNVVDCPAWGHPMGEAMKKRFGIPYLSQGRSIGVEATKRWIKDLAQAMNAKDRAEEFIEEEYGKIKDTWERAKELAQGKFALIEAVRAGGIAVTRSLAQARFAMELGMKPYLFNIVPPGIKSKEYVINYFFEQGVNPLVLTGPYPYQDGMDIVKVIEHLGISMNDVVYFANDVFNWDKAGSFDPCNAAKVDCTAQPFRRLRERPRDFGFRAAEGMARDVINGILSAKRKKKPTFQGRLWGTGFDFMIYEKNG